MFHVKHSGAGPPAATPKVQSLGIVPWPARHSAMMPLEPVGGPRGTRLAR